MQGLRTKSPPELIATESFFTFSSCFMIDLLFNRREKSCKYTEDSKQLYETLDKSESFKQKRWLCGINSIDGSACDHMKGFPSNSRFYVKFS